MMRTISSRDRDLIDEAKQLKTAFPWEGIIQHVTHSMKVYQGRLRPLLGGLPLFDIGCGLFGGFWAKVLLGQEPLDGEYLTLGIPRMVTVDPFVDSKTVMQEGNLDGKLKHVQTDGLSFLLTTDEFPGNVMTNGLDGSQIENPRYAERMVEVIHDRLPRGGVYICDESDVFREPTKRVFGLRHLCVTSGVYRKE